MRASNGKRRLTDKDDERDQRGRQRADDLVAKQVLEQAQKRACISTLGNGGLVSGTTETGAGDCTIGVTQGGADELGGNKEHNSESSSQVGANLVGGDKENNGEPAVNGVGQTAGGDKDLVEVDKTGRANTTGDNNQLPGKGVETNASSRSSEMNVNDHTDDDKSRDSSDDDDDGGDDGEGDDMDVSIDLEATIRDLKKQLEESKQRESANALANGPFSLVDLSGVRATNQSENGVRGAGREDLDVSSLGTVLTAGAAGLLKDVEFTVFVNRKAFRYAKYWVTARDAPVDSALANYFNSNWYGDYVQRTLGRHPRFDDWWMHNGVYIRQRLNQKRTNNIGQLRKIFKGMFSWWTHCKR